MRVIYEPKGKAREYAELARNLYNGCTNGCLYCYAARYQGADYHKEAKLRKGLFENLLPTRRLRIGGLSGASVRGAIGYATCADTTGVMTASAKPE